MPVGVLTAALQELTPRDKRDPDPDLAVEEWLDFAAELGADCIELSAALHPSLADVPPEAMLDPVANTLDLRDPFDEQRAKRVLAAVDATGVSIADVAYFDDMLHEDPAIRRKKHEFMLAGHGYRGTAGCLGGDRLRRAQPVEVDGPEPDRLRGELRAAARRRPRTAGCRTGSSSARCRAGRPATTSTTTSRYTPGDVDRPAPDRRAQRGR